MGFGLKVLGLGCLSEGALVLEAPGAHPDLQQPTRAGAPPSPQPFTG